MKVNDLHCKPFLNLKSLIYFNNTDSLNNKTYLNLQTCKKLHDHKLDFSITLNHLKI